MWKNNVRHLKNGMPIGPDILFFEMPGGILHFVTPNTLRKISEVFLGKGKKSKAWCELFTGESSKRRRRRRRKENEVFLEVFQ